MGVPFTVIKEYLNEWGHLKHVPLAQQEYDMADRFRLKRPLRVNSLYLCEGADLPDVQASSAKYNLVENEYFLMVCVFPSESAACSGDAACEQCAAVSNDHLKVIPLFTGSSVDRVHYHLYNYLTGLLSWKYSMAKAMLSGAMYQEIVNMGAAVLREPLYITDARYALVACANTQDETSPILRELLDTGHLTEETLKGLQEGGYVTKGMIPRQHQLGNILQSGSGASDAPRFVSHVFRVEGRFYLHALMTCRNGAPTPGKRYLFDVLVENLNHCVMKEYYQMGGRHRSENDAILSLVRGEELDAEALYSFAQINEVDFEKPLRLIQMRGTRTVPTTMLLSMLERYIPHCLVGQAGGALYVLMNYGDQEECRQFEASFQQFCLQNKAFAGISLPFSQVEHAYYAFLQTEAMLALPRTALPGLSNAPVRSGAVTFKASARLCLLHCEADVRDELIAYLAAHNPLASMLASDAPDGEQNVQFIRSYIRTGGDMAALARQFGTHRNSMYYRLAQIRRKYGLDLESYEERAFLDLMADLMVL